MTISTSVSRQAQAPNHQNFLLKAAKQFWAFSNFYGEYNTVSPKDRLNYIESLDQK